MKFSTASLLTLAAIATAAPSEVSASHESDSPSSHYYEHYSADGSSESAPSQYSHPNRQGAWQNWEYDAEFDNGKGWELNDKMYAQEKTEKFGLKVACRGDAERIESLGLAGATVQALPDGALGLKFDSFAHKFYAQVGKEYGQLFHAGVKKPIGVIGGQNLMHTVVSSKVAARPWSVEDDVLTLNGECAAVACPIDENEEQFILHWGEDYICQGGVGVRLTPQYEHDEE